MIDKASMTRLLAISMAMAFILAACMSPPTAEPVSVSTGAPYPVDTWSDVDPSGQTINFWHQFTQSSDSALNKIVDDFNETNEWGITVQAQYQGSYGDISNKVLGVLNTPDVPDLVVAYQDQAATYQLANGLLDMRSLINDSKWGLSETDQKDFFPGFWRQDIFPTFGNAHLGLPLNRSMIVMYYNSDWLRELGYDAPPATPAQFKEMACQAAKTSFTKAAERGSMGYALYLDASRFASWVFAFGGDVFDYHTNQYVYNSEAAQKAMNFLQSLFEDGCAAIVTRSYGDQADFSAGKLLFTIDVSSSLPFYDKVVKGGAAFDWGVAAIPHTAPDPVMNIYGASVSIPKTSPEKELAAWLFLKYCTSPDVQAEWAMASRYFPVREAAVDHMSDYLEQNPAYKTVFDLLKYSTSEPPVPGYDFVGEKVSEALAAIVNGADIKTTLDGLNAEANTILSERMISPLPMFDP